MGKRHWPRIIVHMDMDAYFAQVEQRDHPEWRNTPVAITNGQLGSCIITSSYEARVRGVKTGMKLAEAKQLCPQLLQVPSRPAVYAAISKDIMCALSAISPDMEIFSVDEAFLDLSRCRGLYQSAKQVAVAVQAVVLEASGLTCSVGVGGDKTLAKIASKRYKPNGVAIIPPWESRDVLAPMLVTDICGINKGVATFLAQYGVYRCGDMEKIPMSVLSKRFGSLGRRLWLMCLGQDPEPVKTVISLPLSVGHGKVLPPQTQDKSVILYFLSHMAEKVARRLRAYSMCAQNYYIGLKTREGWLANHYKTAFATQDGRTIYRLAQYHVEEQWQGEGVFQCQVTALQPEAGSKQLDFFSEEEPSVIKRNEIMDAIHKKFGVSSLTHANQLSPLSMPDVISPAWKPDQFSFE